MIKACIFDLDGVIVDTAKYHHEAWNKVAERFGTTLELQDQEALKGVSRLASLDYILAKAKTTLSTEEKIKTASVKNEHYLKLISKIDRSELLDNVMSFLEDLQNHGIRIGLGSASKNAGYILERLSLTHFFEVIVDGNSVINSKPDPEVFLKGLDQLDLEASEVVVFEDSSKGIKAALSGGFKTIGIGDPNNLSEAHHVIPGFNNFNVTKLKTFFDS